MSRLTICLLFISVSCLCYAEKTVNRMILKINNNAYTQREMETYLLVKALQKDKRSFLATAENWSESLKNYKEDMLIYEEALKLRFNFGRDTDLKETVEMIMAKVTKDKDLNPYAKRLLLIEEDYAKALSLYKNVEKYRPSLKENPSNLAQMPPDRRVSYLERRNYSRFYDDAFTYRVIEPSLFVSKD